MNRFYTAQPLGVGEVTLEGPEAHHLGTVRRLEVGESVTLFNGDGAEYPAEILSISKKQVVLMVAEHREVSRELPHRLIMASALPKGDRLDFLLEKLTELGVTAWIPLICERSVVSPKEAKREKFERHVIEASKQCGRNVLMQVESPIALSELVQQPRPELKLYLHPGDGALPWEATGLKNGVLVVVGPEGGLSDKEVSQLTEANWQKVQLGPRILRIETAAIAAAARFGLSGEPATAVAKA